MQSSDYVIINPHSLLKKMFIIRLQYITKKYSKVLVELNNTKTIVERENSEESTIRLSQIMRLFTEVQDELEFVQDTITIQKQQYSIIVSKFVN